LPAARAPGTGRVAGKAAEAAKDGLRYLSACLLRFGACLDFESAGIQSCDDCMIRNRALAAFSAQQPLKPLFHRGRDAVPVMRRETVQDELFDMKLYTHPVTSESASGRSILVNSLRAAESRCDMRTGSPASAARNAAPMAMF